MPPKKTNKIKLKVVRTSADYDKKLVKGRELFPELYGNIYIAGRKKSGKTQLLYNILEKTAGRDTKILLFSATVNKDPTYKEIVKMLDRRSIDHAEFEHFIDDEGNDLLAEFIAEAKERAEREEQEEQEQQPPPTMKKYKCLEEARMRFGDEIPRAEITERMKQEQEDYEKKQKDKKKGGKRKKLLTPDYILVFDDLGEDLRKKALSQLLIKNRHFKCKTITLSQWLSYLPPTAIRQLDYILLFGGFNDEKLTDIHLKLDIPDSVQDFIAKYRMATADKYNFLYYDIAEDVYRHNFNEKI